MLGQTQRLAGGQQCGRVAMMPTMAHRCQPQHLLQRQQVPHQSHSVHLMQQRATQVSLPQRSSPKLLRNKIVSAAAAASDAAAQPPAVPKGTSTFVQAVLNVVNVMMGVGLLSLPFALKSSGWIGIGLLWLMGLVTLHTGKALTECASVVVKQRNLPAGTVVGYEEIAETAFGKLGRLLISSIIYVELFGTCCLLFILEGDNMFSLFGKWLATSASQYQLLAAALMIPTVWLPDVSALSFLGIFGVAATFTVVASVAYTFLSGNFAANAATDLALPATLPLVFGIMTFCYSGHGVFPAIQASMKEPETFPKVLNTAFLLVAFLCTFIGASGYYMYGHAAADVVIFNLPRTLATVCSCLVLINPVVKFAITMEPVSAAAVRFVGGGKSLSGVSRLAVRTGLALAILLAARSVPFLAHMMALVGSFMTISVSVTFPALCLLVLKKDSLSGPQVAWNWFVVALGLACTIAGTTASMKSLAAKAAAASVGA